jgi:hypothetical protein
LAAQAATPRNPKCVQDAAKFHCTTFRRRI